MTIRGIKVRKTACVCVSVCESAGILCNHLNPYVPCIHSVIRDTWPHPLLNIKPWSITKVGGVNFTLIQYCFSQDALYLFRAGESLRLQEEICERHEDEETQVGEERDEVPQTCRDTDNKSERR